MHTPEQRIVELRHELGMLRTALEFTAEPAARNRIFARVNACVMEYTQLVEARLSAVVPADEPLRERSLGEASPG
jgi:hypothetical protein